jgi:hypothetical protein
VVVVKVMLVRLVSLEVQVVVGQATMAALAVLRLLVKDMPEVLGLEAE